MRLGGTWFSASGLGRSRNCPDLRLLIGKIRYVQNVDTYDLITSSEFQKVRSSTAALAQRQRCRKGTWRRVIPSDLVTWPWMVGGHCLHRTRKINGLIVIQEFAALCAAVFCYLWKTLKGDIRPRPSVRGLRQTGSSKVYKGSFHFLDQYRAP